MKDDDSRDYKATLLFFPGILLLNIGIFGFAFKNAVLIIIFWIGIVMVIIGLVLHISYWNDKNKK